MKPLEEQKTITIYKCADCGKEYGDTVRAEQCCACVECMGPTTADDKKMARGGSSNYYRSDLACEWCRVRKSAQFRMLEDIERCGDPWARIFGMSEHGGATRTIASLDRLGLIKRPLPRSRRWQLTDAGKAALKLERHRQCLPAKLRAKRLAQLCKVLGVDTLIGSKRIKAKKRKTKR